MNDSSNTYRVAIVGGGPAGLFLGCCLRQSGVSCIVLERRKAAVTHSRSIGIHPVSLEILEDINLADSFVDKGTKVEEGVAFAGKRHIGTLSFAACPPPYPFILTLPQYKTEQLLADRLRSIDEDALMRNAEVVELNETPQRIELTFSTEGSTHHLSADYVVGCDGKNSFVRNAAAIPFNEHHYPDTYIMGDFEDNTDLGSNAAVYLCRQGLIESFPLAPGMRRWVVKTESFHKNATRNHIEMLVARRIGHNLEDTENSMISSFGVQKALAKTLTKNRVILAGDAAHIVSPIGGQGMNLGWLDAHDLAHCFVEIFGNAEQATPILAAYSKRRLRRAKKVIRRAEFNMMMGRKSRVPLVKETVLRVMLNKPLSYMMARLFTMRGLNNLLPV